LWRMQLRMVAQALNNGAVDNQQTQQKEPFLTLEFAPFER